MNTDKVLRAAGIIGIGYLLFNFVSNQVYSRLGFGNTRINLGRLDPTGVQVEIIQPLVNNNPVSFPLDSLQFQVLYGDNVLTQVTMPQPIVIEGNSSTDLSFNSFLDFSNLAGSVANIIASGQFLQALRVKGVAVSSGLAIPFTHTVSIG